jgi:hypothetical protein
VRGKGRESTREAQATLWWSWASLRWPEVGCRREPEMAAGGELRRRRSGVRGKEGLSWGGTVGAVGGEGATNLGGKRAEEAILRRTEARRRKGGAAALGRTSRTQRSPL